MLHSDDMKLQKQALQRIRKLVEMMGPCLSTHTPKIMVLLIFAIDKEGLQIARIKWWKLRGEAAQTFKERMLGEGPWEEGEDADDTWLKMVTCPEGGLRGAWRE